MYTPKTSINNQVHVCIHKYCLIWLLRSVTCGTSWPHPLRGKLLPATQVLHSWPSIASKLVISQLILFKHLQCDGTNKQQQVQVSIEQPYSNQGKYDVNRSDKQTRTLITSPSRLKWVNMNVVITLITLNYQLIKRKSTSNQCPFSSSWGWTWC